MEKIGRDGRKPKAFVGADIAPHFGMQYKVSVDNKSLLVKGISKTALATAVQSGGTSIADPNPDIEKAIYNAGRPDPVVGHRSRSATHATSPSGNDILREASSAFDRPKAR
jgi:hypothetical protein